MAPKEAKHNLNHSTMEIKHAPARDKFLKSVFVWLDEKKLLDGAEGLWRIHDNLYDVTDYVKKHPGGSFWLESTKGLDITELFESYHIRLKPEQILQKYYVRRATTPRAYPYTFHENGFYRTLKRRVRQALPNIKHNNVRRTKVYIDILMISAIATSIIATTIWSYGLAILAGWILGCTTVAAHNYYHQKDNFRMYYNEIALASSREWRILHVISHHMVTNTIADIQAYHIEPVFQYFPHKKTMLVKYLSWIYGPIFVWPVIFQFLFIARMCEWLYNGDSRCVSKIDFISLTLPTSMYLISGQTFLNTIQMWLLVSAAHNIWVSILGFATTHYHPDAFMDGDAPRLKTDRDWGKCQIDAAMDKIEVTTSCFLSLITFGEHTIHHLFPSLDHGYLQQLYPILEETLKDFNVKLNMTTLADLIKGYFRQLAKEVPNPISRSYL